MKDLKRLDRSILVVALLALIGSVFVLRNIDQFLYQQNERDPNDSIGKISFKNQDVRYKNSSNFGWNSAVDNHHIFSDDSIFIGEKSEAKVDLKNGTEIHLKANSLASFKKLKGLGMLQMKNGSFDILLKGDTVVNLNGVKTKLSGYGSRLNIEADIKTGLSRISVSKGTVKISDKFGQRSLAANESWSNRPQRLEPPEIPKSIEEQIYTYKLYDQYRKEGEHLIKKEFPTIRHFVNLRWPAVFGAKSYKFTLVKKIPVGDRYNNNVSESVTENLRTAVLIESPGTYRVTAQSLKEKMPALNSKIHETKDFQVITQEVAEAPQFTNAKIRKPIHLLHKAHHLKLGWSPSKLFTNYVLEISHSPSFAPDTTRVVWVHGTESRLKLRKAQSYYFRVRGVTAKTELGIFSEPYSVITYRPTRLAAPKIRNTDGFELPFKVRKRPALLWSIVPGAKKYLVEYFSSASNEKVDAFKTSSQSKVWDYKTPGAYRVRVTGIDSLGRYGRPSGLKSLSIKKPPRLRLAKKTKKRKVASDSTIRKKVGPYRRSYNGTYSNSQLQIEGASLALTNSTAGGLQDDFALAMAFTLRGLYWWGRRHGVEGSFKSGVLGYNDAGQKVAPMLLDVRYHYRWNPSLSWFSFLREFQISLFAGMEHYRNNSSGDVVFIDSYTLLKGGFGLKFPLWKKWDTGGELAYAMGVRGMSKQELQGYVNYYFKPQWSLGMGYRVHLFRVSEVTDSPDGILPYAEAYGEAFGNLRYSF